MQHGRFAGRDADGVARAPLEIGRNAIEDEPSRINPSPLAEPPAGSQRFRRSAGRRHGKHLPGNVFVDRVNDFDAGVIGRLFVTNLLSACRIDERLPVGGPTQADDVGARLPDQGGFLSRGQVAHHDCSAAHEGGARCVRRRRNATLGFCGFPDRRRVAAVDGDAPEVAVARNQQRPTIPGPRRTEESRSGGLDQAGWRRAARRRNVHACDAGAVPDEDDRLAVWAPHRSRRMLDVDELVDRERTPLCPNRDESNRGSGETDRQKHSKHVRSFRSHLILRGNYPTFRRTAAARRNIFGHLELSAKKPLIQ